MSVPHRIWLVSATQGQYSDRSWWVVAWCHTKDAADKLVTALEEQQRQLTLWDTTYLSEHPRPRDEYSLHGVGGMPHDHPSRVAARDALQAWVAQYDDAYRVHIATLTLLDTTLAHGFRHHEEIGYSAEPVLDDPSVMCSCNAPGPCTCDLSWRGRRPKPDRADNPTCPHHNEELVDARRETCVLHRSGS